MVIPALVTTNFSEDIASFEKIIYLANSHEAFLKMINLAVNDNSLEKKIRVEIAQENSWKIGLISFGIWFGRLTKNNMKNP